MVMADLNSGTSYLWWSEIWAKASCWASTMEGADQSSDWISEAGDIPLERRSAGWLLTWC